MTSNDLKVTSKDDDKAFSKKIKSKSNLRGRDPDDVNQSDGKNIFEPAFSSLELAEFKEFF